MKRTALLLSLLSLLFVHVGCSNVVEEVKKPEVKQNATKAQKVETPVAPKKDPTESQLTIKVTDANGKPLDAMVHLYQDKTKIGGGPIYDYGYNAGKWEGTFKGKIEVQIQSYYKNHGYETKFTVKSNGKPIVKEVKFE